MIEFNEELNLLKTRMEQMEDIETFVKARYMKDIWTLGLL